MSEFLFWFPNDDYVLIQGNVNTGVLEPDGTLQAQIECVEVIERGNRFDPEGAD